MIDQSLDLCGRGDLLHQPQVEAGDRPIGDDRSCLAADPAAAKSPHVERWLTDQLKAAALRLRRAETEGTHLLAVIIGCRGDRPPLELAQRCNIIIESLDQHSSRLGVLHRRQQPGQPHRRVRRPVAVVTAVQRPDRSVYGDLHSHDSPRAEIEGRQP